jgi:hypothetical protein
MFPPVTVMSNLSNERAGTSFVVPELPSTSTLPPDGASIFTFEPVTATACEVEVDKSVPGLVCAPRIRIAVSVVLLDRIKDSVEEALANLTPLELANEELPEMLIEPVLEIILNLPAAETAWPPVETPEMEIFPPPE